MLRLVVGADEEMMTCQNLEGKPKTQIPWLVVVPVNGSLLATGTGNRALKSIILSARARITIYRRSSLTSAKLDDYNGVTQQHRFRI